MTSPSDTNTTDTEAPEGTRVRPERLLQRSDPTAMSAPRPSARAARSVVMRLLGRIQRDRVIVVERGGAGLPPTVGETEVQGNDRITTLGSPVVLDCDQLIATIEILDPRAWTALVKEGSIGLGRGYFEGWWDSDDPVTVVRSIIRSLEPIDELRNRISNATGWATDRIRAALPKASRSRNREDIASHYDLGNDFFRIFLDETLTYSSAIFPSAEAALAEGSHHKYDRLLSKLGVSSEHSVLEIGTGWGGFALRAVDTAGCRVTTTTISKEQLKEARRRVGIAGRSDDVTLLDSDWRDLEGRFDRIVSIEMIEAVDWRDYDRYFATIERCLEDDGLAAIQAICVPDRRYERTKNTEDFIRRFIFPGGFLPSIGAITKSVGTATRMQVIDVEDLSAHYAETLRQWRETFDDKIDEVYALGLDERFVRLWRFYLAYCEAGFLERHCTVNQFVLAGRRWRPEGLELRPN